MVRQNSDDDQARLQRTESPSGNRLVFWNQTPWRIEGKGFWKNYHGSSIETERIRASWKLQLNNFATSNCKYLIPLDYKQNYFFGNSNCKFKILLSIFANLNCNFEISFGLQSKLQTKCKCSFACKCKKAVLIESIFSLLEPNSKQLKIEITKLPLQEGLAADARDS